MGNFLPFLASASGDTTLNINLEPSKLFEYANVIIDAMLPVAYITIGIGLGYTIIRALRNAIS